MKKTILYLLATILLLFDMSSCDDFGDVNVDPQSYTEKNMPFPKLFTASQIFVSGRDWAGWRNNLIYCSTMMQHLASVEGFWAGDKYTYNSGYNAAYFDSYDGGLKDIIDVYNHWKDKPEMNNEVQMCRIVKVILMHRMTDMYGDVPYREAGLGYIEKKYFPKYDEQRYIYINMLEELEDAAIKITITADNKGKSSIAEADVMYKGDLMKWKRTAYSLMLRLGMRLSKVEPSTAEIWVKKAFDSGMLTSDYTQDMLMNHDNKTDDSAEASGKVLIELDRNSSRVSKTFIDMLQSTNDPRLPYIATVCHDPDNAKDLGNNDPTIQLGMPNGWDKKGQGIATDIAYSPNWKGLRHEEVTDPKDFDYALGMNKYSVVNRETFARLDAPTLIITHAQNQLLLAEAADRGWVTGNPADYYKAGVEAAMKTFLHFGKKFDITDAQINAYLTANPYNAANAREQINTQYWIVCFMDEYEAWANWRRTGYPALTPVNYTPNDTGGTIPRRFTYSTTETTNNSKHYLEAVNRLPGGDKMTSRVWWDKE